MSHKSGRSPEERPRPSGVLARWTPRTAPADRRAQARLQEWIEGGGDGGLDAAGLDLSGADLSGGAFRESWFTEAELVGTRLVGADFYRSDAQGADFSGADLTQASLVRADFGDAVLRGAILDGADLVKASLCGADASAASLRGTRVMGCSLIDVDLRGADLSGAVVRENTFKVTVDETTRFTGLCGTLFGPVQATGEEGRRKIGGGELERWLRQRGARVAVLPLVADATGSAVPPMAFEDYDMHRIEVDDPDADMDDALRLLYQGELFTGEVTEHLGTKLVSLDVYVEGLQHGPSWEWYQDGTLRSEGTVLKNLARGEHKQWHPNGALASRRVFTDDGLTILEDHEWDEDGVPTKSWRADRTS